MLSKECLEIFQSLDVEVGRGWYRHAKMARATDDLLRVPVADGVFTAKIDGWIHAFTATNQSIVKYIQDPDAGLDIEHATEWTGGNSALRYGRWQADFHWEIDTRAWQYILYFVFARRAYRDAIMGCDKFSPEEKAELWQVVQDFLDEADIAYLYRMEVIERARGFAPHPDDTAGASTHGYTYTKMWDHGEYSYDDLPLMFHGKKIRAEPVPLERQRVPKPFPAADKWWVEGRRSNAARAWLDAARTRDMVDEWLRVPLGDRMVPTRLDGWEAGLDETLRFLAPFREGRTAAVAADATIAGLDARDYAVRFGLSQVVFQRRLKGEREQLLALLETQADALRQMAGQGATEEAPGGGAATDEAAGDGAAIEAAANGVAAFLARAAQAVQQAWTADDSTLTADVLPELEVARPLHPRYAHVDPLEPLPWQKSDSDRYLRKMAQLGYTL